MIAKRQMNGDRLYEPNISPPKKMMMMMMMMSLVAVYTWQHSKIENRARST